MHHLTKILAAASILASLQGNAIAQEVTDAAVYSRLLQALKYAEVFRISLGQACVTPSPDAQLRALCGRLASVPDSVIDRAAEPHLRKYVPPSEARKALSFWASPEGAAIKGKILAYMRGVRPDGLTPSEISALQTANGSSYGIALDRLAHDTSASIAVIREVAASAP